MDDDFKVLLSKAMKYCSQREVCISQITQKLTLWGVQNLKTSEKIIEQLIAEKFIDEQRYANAYTLDKFKMNKWGKNKIKFNLKNKNIPEKIIQNSLSTIQEKEYLNTAISLLVKKNASMKIPEPKVKKQKLYNFLISKGFEPDIFYKVFSKI